MPDKAWYMDRYKHLGETIAPVSLKPTLRVNTLRITHGKLVSRLESLGVKLEKVAFARDAYRVVSSKFSLGAITEFLLGYYYLQEIAAQLPVQVLDPKPEETVLDCCAAPGGKTTQLSQWMNNQGVAIALEKANFRIQSLKSNIERMGCTNIAAFNTSAEHAVDLGMQFDKVLVDAPCAGNYAGDPKWFGKHDAAVFRKNSEEQKRILSAAVAATKKGSIVVYSTCSLEPEEDESVVDWALRNLPVRAEPVELSLGDSGLTNPFGRTLHKDVGMCKRLWPHKTGTEGFFIAKLRKWE